ncbi:MAG: ASKHA domain-containing protein [Caldilineales bacterium]|nr:ASKHA domain-containing protein [Caldilineales bacterium]MDW8316750.1 ASKHA domain-containing protein [Anaerolineae bacterium]
MPHVLFLPAQRSAEVSVGASLLEAAQACGVEIHIPCGGQGRCGRCAVVVQGGDGRLRRRSTIRLSPADIAAGYALACQSLVLGDLAVVVPPQEEIARHLVTAKHAVAVEPPAGYTVADQPLQAFFLALDPPSLADQTDDWSRLQRGLAGAYGVSGLTADMDLLRRLGEVLRSADWQVTAVVELDAWDRPAGPPRLVDLLPGRRTDALHAIAVDIGTTTVSLFLVDLMTGRVVARAADYNDQIRRGEDIISRIVYASRKAGNSQPAANSVNSANLVELQALVVGTINRLVEQACRRAGVEPKQVYKATVVGNPTMIHLFLGVPPEQIRLAPYIPALNQVPSLPGAAQALGLAIHPQATVDCLPGVASYVGADITAGVLSSGMHRSEALRLFIDIGTNGETVLGNADWLICCACSAGPAFEGAGVEHGTRAAAGAIEEVWINGDTGEPTYRTVGNLPPKGLCGSGLISLLAELFLAGLVDKRGRLNQGWPGLRDRPSLGPRVRRGDHGLEYVVAWAEETAIGRDIVLTEVDIDNLLRTKAAIFAGFTSLAEAVGVPLEAVEEVLIGGAFGQHINVEKAVEIGLLPDLGTGEGWSRFRFLGNTALNGAYLALVSRAMRQEVRNIANKMTYLELSADNRFYEQFMSAMFLPHTDARLFPSVASRNT